MERSSLTLHPVALPAKSIVRQDPEAGMLYIEIDSSPIERVRLLSDSVRLDLAADDHVRGVEVQLPSLPEFVTLKKVTMPSNGKSVILSDHSTKRPEMRDRFEYDEEQGILRVNIESTVKEPETPVWLGANILFCVTPTEISQIWVLGVAPWPELKRSAPDA